MDSSPSSSTYPSASFRVRLLVSSPFPPHGVCVWSKLTDYVATVANRVERGVSFGVTDLSFTIPLGF